MSVIYTVSACVLYGNFLRGSCVVYEESIDCCVCVCGLLSKWPVASFGVWMYIWFFLRSALSCVCLHVVPGRV